MTIEGKLKKRMDDRFSWSFVGAILALVGISITIVTVYWGFHESRPDVVYEIESQSDVFDLHRPLKDLTLSFRGQDVQEQNLNLRILTVRVWNRGGKDILQDQYDQADPWGIKVEPGQIIEVRVGENNSEYLASHITPHIAPDNTVVLNKTILEHDKYVTLDILILHHRDAPPRIAAFGKIAGLEHIGVTDASAQRGKPTFWGRVWSGTAAVNAVRFIISVVGFFLLIIIAVVITVAKEELRKWRRRRRARTLIEDVSGDPKILQVLRDVYVESGTSGLKDVQDLLVNHRPGLNLGLSRYLERSRQRERFQQEPVSDSSKSQIVLQSPDSGGGHPVVRLPDSLVPFADEGLITLTEDKSLHVDPRVTATLDEVLARFK